MSEQLNCPREWIKDTLLVIVNPSRPITYGIVQPGPRMEPDKGIPMIRGQDYSSGSVQIYNLYHVSPKLAQSFARASVQGGDLLLSIVGYVGTVAEVPNELAGANLTQTTARISLKKDIASRYFYHFFRSNFFKEEVKKFTKGSAQPGLNLADVEKMRVIYPSSPNERDAIGGILDALDTTIRQTEAIIEKLKQIKQGLLHDLLTRGIDANGGLRPPPELAPQLYKESPMGRIPKEWEALQMKETCAVIDSLHQTPVFSEDGIPMVRVTDIKVGQLDLSKCERVSPRIYKEFTLNHKPKRNDIVLSRVGSYGVSSINYSDYPFCMGQNTVVITGHNNQQFLYYVLQNSAIKLQFDLYVAGSSQKTLSLKAIKESYIPNPNAEEQQRISERMTSLWDRLAMEQDQLAKLQNQKSALMDDLLTGRVRVTPLLAQAEAAA
jgi:type I restriction enzyme S subunit